MLHEKIRHLRTVNNLSQVNLANALGISKQCVSNWENDNILPSIEMLVKIAKYFSVSTDYLLGLDNRRYLEITDLSDETLSHIQLLINDLTEKKQKNI